MILLICAVSEESDASADSFSASGAAASVSSGAACDSSEEAKTFCEKRKRRLVQRSMRAFFGFERVLFGSFTFILLGKSFFGSVPPARFGKNNMGRTFQMMDVGVQPHDLCYSLPASG